MKPASHFDKMLLSGFLVLFFAGVLFSRKMGWDDAFDFTSRAFDITQGALLGLITGWALGKSGKPPELPTGKEQ